jgi:hypothetical protein
MIESSCDLYARERLKLISHVVSRPKRAIREMCDIGVGVDAEVPSGGAV